LGEFLKRHAKTMWQCDFCAKKIITKTSLRRGTEAVLAKSHSNRLRVGNRTAPTICVWV
jgi:ribosomal protein L37AE/L43A